MTEFIRLCEIMTAFARGVGAGCLVADLVAL
jgi:hypothetical protein